MSMPVVAAAALPPPPAPASSLSALQHCSSASVGGARARAAGDAWIEHLFVSPDGARAALQLLCRWSPQPLELLLCLRGDGAGVVAAADEPCGAAVAQLLAAVNGGAGAREGGVQAAARLLRHARAAAPALWPPPAGLAPAGSRPWPPVAPPPLAHMLDAAALRAEVARALARGNAPAAVQLRGAGLMAALLSNALAARARLPAAAAPLPPLLALAAGGGGGSGGDCSDGAAASASAALAALAAALGGAALESEAQVDGLAAEPLYLLHWLLALAPVRLREAAPPPGSSAGGALGSYFAVVHAAPSAALGGSAALPLWRGGDGEAERAVGEYAPAGRLWYHGTASERAYACLQTGLRPQSGTRGERTGAMYGEGVYLAGSPRVAEQFAVGAGSYLPLHEPAAPAPAHQPRACALRAVFVLRALAHESNEVYASGDEVSRRLRAAGRPPPPDAYLVVKDAALLHLVGVFVGDAPAALAAAPAEPAVAPRCSPPALAVALAAVAALAAALLAAW